MRICPCIILFKRDPILRPHATRAHTQLHSLLRPPRSRRCAGMSSSRNAGQPTQEFITGAQYDQRLILLCLLLALFYLRDVWTIAVPIQLSQVSPFKTGQGNGGEMTHHPLLAGLQPARGYMTSPHIINFNLNLVKCGEARTHKTASCLVQKTNQKLNYPKSNL